MSRVTVILTALLPSLDRNTEQLPLSLTVVGVQQCCHTRLAITKVSL